MEYEQVDNLPENVDKPDMPLEAVIKYIKQGLTVEEVGKLFSRSKQAVSKKLVSHGLTVAQIREPMDNEADVLKLKRSVILNSLSLSDIQKLSAYQRILVYAILYDKGRLEEGKASQIFDIKQFDIELSQARKLEKELIELSKNAQGVYSIPKGGEGIPDPDADVNNSSTTQPDETKESTVVETEGATVRELP